MASKSSRSRASDSSPSSTPILTPDSTGVPSTGSPESVVTFADSSSGSPGAPDAAAVRAAKKSRRQTAFYPNMNAANKPQKPFSRSAAKRESVMALGTIEHLQHYFTKTGLAAKKNPLDKPHHGLVPAIGGIRAITSPTLQDLPVVDLPPSPDVPEISAPPPFIRNYETDPEVLLPGMIEDLIHVATVWRIDQHPALSSSSPPQLSSSNLLSVTSASSFDVLGVLKTTTRAIRSVRNYVFSLPDDSTGTVRVQFRPTSLSQSTKSQPERANPAASHAQTLSLIRRAALEVLTVLRELEERCRVPLDDDAYDAQSDGGGARSDGGHRSDSRTGARSDSRSGPRSRMASPSNLSDEIIDDASVTFIQVQGQSVPVWEDDDQDLFIQEEQKKDGWDERLVLAGGWLYRQDIDVANLMKEQGAVKQYLDVVDEVLFGGPKQDSRGWEREKKRLADKFKGMKGKQRRTSAGEAERDILVTPGIRRVSMPGLGVENMRLEQEPGEMDQIAEETEDIDEDDLPQWARRDAFPENPLARAHALLFALLPGNLIDALEPPSSRALFLDSLSSGQLLCIAYNAGVRKSKKPWGYVNRDGIHDILALEKAQGPEDTKKGWTFRRTDNLRLWVGALKLRYILPIVAASQAPKTSSNTNTPLTSPSPSAHRFPTNEPPILFDAKVVAGRLEGWEEMLERLVLRWVDEVVLETRTER
ncbi:hypothetical protein C8J56DRAFT_836115 [Mycena floridula]|nr:hypothetical protein C8J56DRAFT_836115 [Mycena floridula]